MGKQKEFRHDRNDHRKGIIMMYPFMTLDDETEIFHSEMLMDGSADIHIEKADETHGFYHMTVVRQRFGSQEKGNVLGRSRRRRNCKVYGIRQ